MSRALLTIDRLPDDESGREGEWVSDAEIFRRWGVGEKTGRVAIRELSRSPRFPRKDPLFGNKRYWNAVQAFLKHRAGLNVAAPMVHDGKDFTNEPPQDRQRPGPRMASSR